MLKDIPSQPDILKTAKIETFSKHYERYITLLEQAEIENPAYHPERAEKIKISWDMINLQSPDTRKNRIILHDNAMAILPENPTIEEKELANFLTNLASKTIKKYRQKHALLSTKDIPITTLFIRETNDMKKLMRKGREKVGGVISITNPPLWNLFNIESATKTFTILREKLGENIAKKIIWFSYLHECGHLIMEQHRMETLRNKEFDDYHFAKTFYGVYYINSVAWELAGNEFANESTEILENDLPVFPNIVASLTNDLHPEIKIDEIIKTGNIDLFEEPEEEIKNLDLKRPFVSSPHWAQTYLYLDNLTKFYRSEVNPNFNWTDYVRDYINSFPLADHEFPLPKEFESPSVLGIV